MLLYAGTWLALLVVVRLGPAEYLLGRPAAVAAAR
jgi:hypothetical protein